MMGTSPKWEIPFYDLFAELSENGFAVEITDYQECLELIKNLNSNDSSEIQSAKLKMASVICRNADEQRKFYTRFDSYVLEKKQHLQQTRVIAEEVKKEEEIKRRKKISWITVLSLFILIISAVYFYLIFNQPIYTYIFSGPDHIVAGQIQSFKSIDDQQFNKVNLSLFKRLLYTITRTYPDTSQLNVHWDFGDGTTSNQINPTHVYQNTGSKVIKIDFQSKQHTDTIFVCDISPSLDSLHNEGSVNEIYHLTIPDSNDDKPITWTVDDSSFTSTKKFIPYTFSDEGTHTVGAKFANQICQHENSKNVNIKRKEKFYLSANTTPIKPESVSTIRNRTYTLGLLLLSSIGACFIVRIFQKRAWKKKETEKLNNTIKEPFFTGKKPPFNLEFINRDELIQVKSIHKWSRDLNKSINIYRYYLDLNKTIRATINNEDLFTPEYSKLKSTRKFVFIIDKRNGGNVQTELFRFVTQKLEQYQVNLEWYYFEDDPELLFAGKSGKPITINKIRDLNYQSVLVLWSDGYSFKIPGRQILKERLIEMYGSWEVRILLTPLPYMDWSLSESVLSEFFKIFPTDETELPGILAYLDNLINDERITSENNATYPIKNIQFEDVGKLREYCKEDPDRSKEDPDLFACVCALAVYPKIKWPMVLQIIGTIAPQKLNYTNLLKISRISWIQTGSFSARLRLELLKQLPVVTEIKTREAIISLLEQTPTKKDDYTSDEKSVQLLVNKFVLFGHDPLKYAKYSDAEKEFLHLYKNNKFNDISLKTYLEKNDPEITQNTPENSWKTPVNSTKTGNNTTIKEYWSEKSTRSKFKTLLDFPLVALIIILATGFLSFQLKDKVAIANKLNSFLIEESTILPSNINISFNKDSCYTTFSKNEPLQVRFIPESDSKPDKITSGGVGGYYSGGVGANLEYIKDSSDLSLPGFSKYYKENVTIELKNRDGDLLTYRTTLDSDSMTLNVSSAACNPPPEKLISIYYETGEYERYAAELSKHLETFHYKTDDVRLLNQGRTITYFNPPYPGEINRIDSIVSIWKQQSNATKLMSFVYNLSEKGTEIRILKKNPPPVPFVCKTNPKANYIIYYDLDKVTLRPEAKIELDRVVKYLNEYPDYNLRVESHTDDMSSDIYNLDKSTRQAKSVADYLIKSGINPDRVVAEGYGESRPITLISTIDDKYINEARQCNRRTEIFLVKSKGETNNENNPEPNPPLINNPNQNGGQGSSGNINPINEPNVESNDPCITITESEILYRQKNPEKVCAINLELEGSIEPEIFIEFTNLVSLTLNGERLSKSNNTGNATSNDQNLKIPETLRQLTMTHLQLQRINFVGRLQKLDSLNLSNNNISDIYPLTELRSLRVLNLSKNNISELDPLMKMPGIVELDLSYNNLTDISPLMKMTNLRMVNLTGNYKLNSKAISMLRKEFPKLEIIYKEPASKN